MAQAVVPSRINVEVLRGNPARLRRERVMRGLFFSAAFLSVVISVGIVVSLAGGALDFLRKVPFASLWSDGWFPRNNLFDIKTIIAGTLIVAAIAMIVAVPLGLGAALYLSEYASPRARRWLKPILETLASVPSVVMGFFAITIISPDLVQKLFGSDVPLFNLLAAGIGVGLLVTPLVASVAEDSMHAVPDALREASYGLGARRRATSIRVVVPAAVSGITAVDPPRRLSGDRRDDDRRDRGRRDRRVAVQSQPSQAGADHDGRHHGAGDRLRFDPRRRSRVSRACSSSDCCCS